MAKERMTGIYDVLNVVHDAIKAAPKAERDALTAAVDAWGEDFPEDYCWAVGPQSPALLHLLINVIEGAAATDDGPKEERVIHLRSREPEGSA